MLVLFLPSGFTAQLVEEQMISTKSNAKFPRNHASVPEVVTPKTVGCGEGRGAWRAS